MGPLMPLKVDTGLAALVSYTRTSPLPSLLDPAATRLSSGLDFEGGEGAGEAGVVADFVEIVADLARLGAVHLVEFRGAVGAADQKLVLGRMAIDRLQAPLQGAGGDAGDVVLEPLRGDLGQLH